MKNVLFLLVVFVIGGLASCDKSVEPDGFAPSIFFKVKIDTTTSDTTLKVTSGSVVLNRDPNLPDWAQKNFYVDECRSTIRVEHGLYVVTLHSTDGRQTLHGQINVNCVALMHKDSTGMCYQITDMRLFNQIKHQKVTANFEEAKQEVGNKAHEGTRSY